MPNRYQVAIGCPGTDWKFSAAAAVHRATLGRHDVELLHSPLGAWDAFNVLWCDALNLALAGEATHYALFHADNDVEPGWLDVLIDEMDRLGADCVGAISAIKDPRDLTSCGILDPDNRWERWRYFTVAELQKLPEVIDAAAAGYLDKGLLNGTGCMVCDLRRPVFRTRNADGEMPICFNFPTRCEWGPDGKAKSLRESEDMYFCRELRAHGGRIYATRRVKLGHLGDYAFPNWLSSGNSPHGDAASAHKWDTANIDAHGCWIGPDVGHYHLRDEGLEKALCFFFAGPEKARYKSDPAVVDFGCGLGNVVRALRYYAIDATGFDGNPATPELTGGRCGVLDLAQPQKLDRQWDWVLCLEVLEHIPAEFEAAALDNLCRHARRGIIMSWSPAGNSGHGHYNPRPLQYAVDRFAERGFQRCDTLSEALRAKATLPWFRENLLVLERVS